MKALKENRAASFVVVSAVYLAAIAVGVAVYNWLPYPWWLSLLMADVAATVLVFAFSLVFKNASVYDPYWSVQPPVILAVSLLAVLLQGVSDVEMHKYRKKRDGAFNRHGL